MSNWIIIGAALVSFALSALIGIVLIPFLKKMKPLQLLNRSEKLVKYICR